MRISSPYIERYRHMNQWFAAGAADPNAPAAVTTYRPPGPASMPALQYARRAAEKLSDVVDRADEARAIARRVLTSAFEKRSAASSDENVVTATATNKATVAAYDITVDRLAAAQQNVGAALSASATGGIAAGTHRFEIAVGSRTKTVTVTTHAYDTNETALTRLRAAIRQADAGVDAALVRDRSAGTVKLQLTATKTGVDNAFAIRDVSGTAVADSGIDAVAQAAADASYRIDGGPAVSSASNDVLLDGGNVVATLRKAGPDPVRLTVGPDADAIVKDVNRLVDAYNELRGGVEAAAGYISPDAARAVERIARSGLSGIGVVRQRDGSLEVDEERLREALTKRFDHAKRLLVGTEGLVRDVQRAADFLAEAPTSALLHPGARALSPFPTYTAQGGLQPGWPLWSGMHFSRTF